MGMFVAWGTVYGGMGMPPLQQARWPPDEL
jgi:hypothetical protein